MLAAVGKTVKAGQKLDWLKDFERMEKRDFEKQRSEKAMKKFDGVDKQYTWRLDSYVV